MSIKPATSTSPMTPTTPTLVNSPPPTLVNSPPPTLVNSPTPNISVNGEDHQENPNTSYVNNQHPILLALAILQLETASKDDLIAAYKRLEQKSTSVILKSDEMIEKLKGDLSEKEKTIDKLKGDLSEKDKTIEKLEATDSEKDKTIEKLKKEVKQLSSKAVAAPEESLRLRQYELDEITHYKERLDDAQDANTQQRKHFRQYEKVIKLQQEQLDGKQNKIKELEQADTELKILNVELDRAYRILLLTSKSLAETASGLVDRLPDDDEECNLLRLPLRKLAENLILT